MRMTRAEYMAARPVRERKPTVREVAKLLESHVRRELKAKGLWEQKPKNVWEWDGGTVIAHCRSDARGFIKQSLGIKKNGRLPVGIQITKIGKVVAAVGACA